MKQDCIHYDFCRNPVQQCNSKCERSRCAERDFGFYNTLKRGKWSIAEMTNYGWKVDWSNWFQNDSNFDGIGDKIDAEEIAAEQETQRQEDINNFMTPEYH